MSQTRAGKILESFSLRRKVLKESSSKFLDWYNEYIEKGDGIEFDEFDSIKEFLVETIDFVKAGGDESDFKKACKDAGMTSKSVVTFFVEEDAEKAVRLLQKSNHRVNKFGDWWVYHVEDGKEPDEQLYPVLVFKDPEEMTAFMFS